MHPCFALAGVYVHSIATGNNAAADVSSSFFGNVNDQVLALCAHDKLTADVSVGCLYDSWNNLRVAR